MVQPDRQRPDDVESLTEKAYREISGAIAALKLKPGEPLTQDRLARWLSISRTPIREALRRLEQEGVIQAIPGRGLVVTELTVEAVEDLFDLLRLMGPHAAHLAARRRTPEQASRLDQAARALGTAADQGDVPAWVDAERRLHEIILEASGNLVLRQFVHDVRRRLHRITIIVATRPERLHAGTRECAAVTEAIVVGNASAAAQRMHEHIDALQNGALALIRTYIVPLYGERF